MRGLFKSFPLFSSFAQGNFLDIKKISVYKTPMNTMTDQEKKRDELANESRKINNRIFVILENRCTGKSKAFQTREESWGEVQHNDNEIVVIEKDAYDVATSNVKYFMNKLDVRDNELQSERERNAKLVEALQNISSDIWPSHIPQTNNATELQLCIEHMMDIADQALAENEKGS